jgi:hypothetical protein
VFYEQEREKDIHDYENQYRDEGQGEQLSSFSLGAMSSRPAGNWQGLVSPATLSGPLSPASDRVGELAQANCSRAVGRQRVKRREAQTRRVVEALYAAHVLNALFASDVEATSSSQPLRQREGLSQAPHAAQPDVQQRIRLIIASVLSG